MPRERRKKKSKIASRRIYPKWERYEPEDLSQLDPKIEFNMDVLREIRTTPFDQIKSKLDHPDFTYYYRGITDAMESNQMETFKHLLSNYPIEDYFYQQLYECAHQYLNREMISYLEDNYQVKRDTGWFISYLCLSGNYEHFLHYFPQNSKHNSNHYMEWGGKGGSLEIINHLASLTTEKPRYLQAIHGAVKHNHLRLLKQLLPKVDLTEEDFDLIVQLSKHSGREMIEYLMDQRQSFSIWETMVTIACEREELIDLVKEKLTPQETDQICRYCGFRIDQHPIPSSFDPSIIPT